VMLVIKLIRQQLNIIFQRLSIDIEYIE